MRILAVDDEKIALESLISAIKKVVSEEKIYGFRNAKEALAFAKETPCDIAFLDIEMREMNGITLAKHLKAINSRINIVFTTGYSEYSGSAFQLHASGYVVKPITADKIRYEIEELRNPVTVTSEKRLRVKAFGNFEAYVGQNPITFHYNKTKELLAYLIDRNGSVCTINEIVGVLWEDDGKAKSHKSYMKNIRADLISTLNDTGCKDVIIKRRGALGIVSDKVDCDYYDWLKGKVSGINAYHGEYMMQYSWSEATHGLLEEGELP